MAHDPTLPPPVVVGGDAAAQGVSWLLARLRRRPVRWGGTSIEQFRREIGKYVDEAEVARFRSYVTL